MNISVIIPSYNRPAFLRSLLISIEAQTLFPDEIIIVNDSPKKDKEYRQVLDDFPDLPLQYLVNEKNAGAPYSRNRGLKIAQGKYVCFTDDDDFWFPNKLVDQIRCMKEQTKKVGACYGFADVVSEDGSLILKMEPFYQGELQKELLQQCFIPSSTVMIRRECFEKVGGFDEQMKSCQDWDMWYRLSRKYDFCCTKTRLIQYNKHTGVTIGGSKNAIEGYKRFLHKHGKDFISLDMKNILRKYYWYVCKQEFQQRKNILEFVRYAGKALNTFIM